MKLKNNFPIGIFDSGLGGLSVLKEIERVLPYENIIYLGDTAHLPYGNKSKTSIIKFSLNNALFLLRFKVKLIVVACNTSSSIALDTLKEIFAVPILGVIEPGIVKAIKISKRKRIGVIGTKSTIESGSYQRQLKSYDKKIKLYARACPLFVPLVEEGILEGELVDRVIELYLREFKEKRIDTLILGCTHYPLLKKAIAEYLRGVKLVDSAEEVALNTRDILKKHKLIKKSTSRKRLSFYVTDEPKGFMKIAKIFLNRKINPYCVNV